MVFSKIHSAQPNLLNSTEVNIESDISNGLHSFSIVGLTDKSINEAKDRVAAAIKNSGFKSPKQQNHKITILLSPANINKSGTIFDLPIALAYLKSSKQIDFDSSKKIFIGELSLDGKIKPVKGIIQTILFAKNNNFKEVYIPIGNSLEASIIEGIDIYPVESLESIIEHLQSKNKIKKLNKKKIKSSEKVEIDFSSIKDNEQSKRSLVIAASGGHNICLYGPPGTGKTMLSKAFCEILPNLNYGQMIETSSIHSIIGNGNLITRPPLRQPHHTSSDSAIIGGGGRNIYAGEITLAHNGVLLMDEFPEFSRRVIDSLRQPIEEKIIRVSRVGNQTKYPCNFQLIATLNPCPCGFKNIEGKECKCTIRQIEKYKNKLSGPILDRIDIFSEVINTNYKDLLRSKKIESLEIRKLVAETRDTQQKRQGKLNSELTSGELRKILKDKKLIKELNSISEKLKISTRSYFKIIKIARTIADIEKSVEIKKPHLLEALQYRNKINLD